MRMNFLLNYDPGREVIKAAKKKKKTEVDAGDAAKPEKGIYY